jgi:AraC family transcriptional regulator
MLSQSLRTNSALRPRFDNSTPFGRADSFVPRKAMLRSIDQPRHLDEGLQSRPYLPAKLSDFPSAGIGDHAVKIFPSHAVRRRSLAWDGMAVDLVQAVTHEAVEFRFRGPVHLLVVYEDGIRGDGETVIEGLPRSTLREVKGKLAFVPAGHEYRDLQEPRSRGRILYIYFDPAKLRRTAGAAVSEALLSPRLFFEDKALWGTAVKLGRFIESGGEDRHYGEALGVVLAHELMHRNAGARRFEPPARGGLAAWQQRIVSAYIEEHIAEPIPLATLAQLVRLSAYHFCRAFKRSFGVPPHRYHNARRIEHAATLLAQPSFTVTQVALRVGFSETSSFTAAFRKATGSTPTAYRRSLG